MVQGPSGASWSTRASRLRRWAHLHLVHRSCTQLTTRLAALPSGSHLLLLTTAAQEEYVNSVLDNLYRSLPRRSHSLVRARPFSLRCAALADALQVAGQP